MEILGIIPARYASSRFPGKPLIDIQGKTMIEHVYLKVKKVLKHAVVATDDEEIKNTVEKFGGDVIMTSTEHISGTSRCIEAYEKYTQRDNAPNIDVVINVQGDEPTLDPDQLDEIISCFYDKRTQIATLVKRINANADVFNPNIVKVVFNNEMFAMYFSRSPIPYVRDEQKENWNAAAMFYKHIGIYAFCTDVLVNIKNLQNKELELTERLEQLNWLYHGYSIKLKETAHENIGIDTPEDLERLLNQGLTI